MRALAALVAVVSLGVIVYWSTSAGEAPAYNLLEAPQDQAAPGCAAGESDAYPGEAGEAGP
ncbi:MAG: hypothetical protein P8169_08530, partial [Chloroflexota bacterium]